jgi:AcrR family transcriptional regulator
MSTKRSSHCSKSDQKSAASSLKRIRLLPQARELMILDAAITFFAEEGFKGQTRALAKRIGVSQSLIYRYFGTKDALIERVYEKTFLSRWNPEWEEMLADRRRPLRDRLRDFYESYLVAIDERNWIRVVMHSSLESSDLTRRYLQGHVTRLLGKIVRELRGENDAARSAEPSPMEIELVWHLHSTIIYYLVRKHIHATPVSLNTEDLVTMIVDNFLFGLCLESRRHQIVRSQRP